MQGRCQPLDERVGPAPRIRHLVRRQHLRLALREQAYGGFPQGPPGARLVRGRALGEPGHLVDRPVGEPAHTALGGDQAIEDAIVLAGRAAPDRPDLAAYTADRRPRTTEIARKAVRDPVLTVLSKAAPALFLRSFDGIADWRPPQRPYASGEARVGD